MQPERWPAAMERLGQSLGGAAFVMSALHRSQGMPLAVVTSQDPTLTHILRTRYNNARTNPLVAAMPGLPVGKLVARRAVHGDEAYFRGELYNEVFRSQDLSHRVIACLHRTEDLVCPLGILRPRPTPDFTPDQIRLLTVLIPHLRRAVRLSLETRTLRNVVQAETTALDQLTHGVFVVDAAGRAVHLNHAAQRIVRQQDGLHLRHGELFAWRHEDTLALRAAMALAMARSHELPGALGVRRRSGKRAYAAIVMPLIGRSVQQPFSAAEGAIIFVGDPSSRPPTRASVLRALFGLSAKEAELAEALLEGMRLEHYAAKRGISVNTVKTQLRAVFGKTHTGRQSELIRVLNAIPVLEEAERRKD